MNGFVVYSQEAIHAEESQVFHKNFIGITLTELPFVDFRISYERRITPTHGIIFSSGYKLAFKGYTDATQVDLGQTPTAWCYRNTATWLYFAVGYRYYFNKNKTIYFSPELFYKYMWADTIVYTFGVGPNGNTLTNQYEVRSMETNLTGLNLLIGKKVRIRFSEGFNMGLDVYSGLTVRYKLINTTIFGSKTASRYHDEGVTTISIPISENPAIINENFFQFSVQFGINLFFSW
jgi:hypothetical protein